MKLGKHYLRQHLNLPVEHGNNNDIHKMSCIHSCMHVHINIYTVYAVHTYIHTYVQHRCV